MSRWPDETLGVRSDVLGETSRETRPQTRMGLLVPDFRGRLRWTLRDPAIPCLSLRTCVLSRYASYRSVRHTSAEERSPSLLPGDSAPGQDWTGQGRARGGPQCSASPPGGRGRGLDPTARIADFSESDLRSQNRMRGGAAAPWLGLTRWSCFSCMRRNMCRGTGLYRDGWLRLASCGAQGIPGLGANPQSDSDWHA